MNIPTGLQVDPLGPLIIAHLDVNLFSRPRPVSTKEIDFALEFLTIPAINTQ
jgi:hypothetical protein